MPAVIDTRRPRVLRYNPNYMPSIPNDPDSNIYNREFLQCNHGCTESNRFLRKTWREQKFRRQKSRCHKVAMDMEAVLSMENIYHTAKELKIQLGSYITCLHGTKIIDNNHDVEDVKSEPNYTSRNLQQCLQLDLHRSTQNRLPKSSAESSQCSSPSKIDRSNNNKPVKQRHNLNCEWFIGKFGASLIKYRFKNNLNKIQRWEKSAINNSKKQLYLQFVLLFFLFTFGHSSVTKSTVSGVVTFSTIFCTPTWAAPIHSVEATNRTERSANLSHMTGTSRWIQMFIRNRFLQILPDGTVNGTHDSNSIYTIVQRIPVAVSQLKIKASATCLYLCMDSCGLLYGSSNITANCIFKEDLKSNGYNFYTSVAESGPRKDLWLALDGSGQSRKLKMRHNNLDKRLNHARVLTTTVPNEKIAALRLYMANILQNQDKIRHARNARHEANLQQKFCSILPDSKRNIRSNSKCKKQKKRRKKKRAPSGCLDNRKHSNFCKTLSLETLDLPDSNETLLRAERFCNNVTSDVLCKKHLKNAPSKKKKSRMKISKRDQKSQLRGKKIVQNVMKKVTPTATLEKVNKLSLIIKQQKRPVDEKMSNIMKEIFTEKMMKTTLPSLWEDSSATLPNWYSISTRSSTWDYSQIHKLSMYPEQSVISEEKPGMMNILRITPKVKSDSSPFSSMFEVSGDPISSAISSDLFISDSEETIYSEDYSPTSYIDYSTLMTTMDTISPEKTEDYMNSAT